MGSSENQVDIAKAQTEYGGDFATSSLPKSNGSMLLEIWQQVWNSKVWYKQQKYYPERVNKYGHKRTKEFYQKRSPLIRLMKRKSGERRNTKLWGCRSLYYCVQIYYSCLWYHSNAETTRTTINPKLYLMGEDHQICRFGLCLFST